MPDEPEAESRTHARQGKFARLPDSLREMSNQRILDGWTGKRICGWLNSLPEVQAILTAEFDGEPITDRNLSRWRKGGYQDWLGERDKIVKMRALAEYCSKLADAGQDQLFAGASNILGGKILELLEVGEIEDVMGLVKAIVALRGNELKSQAQNLAQIKSDQSERALRLAEDRFKRETSELFLKWYNDKRAREIADGKGDSETKLSELADLFWGQMPEGIGPKGGVK